MGPCIDSMRRLAMSNERNRRLTRRSFLAGTAFGVAGAGAAGWAAWHYNGESLLPGGHASIGPPSGEQAMPGKYPGRVIEVHRPGSVLETKTDGYAKRDPEAVAAMVARGMQELVGSEDAVQAWRSMFAVGDHVGIKV